MAIECQTEEAFLPTRWGKAKNKKKMPREYRGKMFQVRLVNFLNMIFPQEVYTTLILKKKRNLFKLQVEQTKPFFR